MWFGNRKKIKVLEELLEKRERTIKRVEQSSTSWFNDAQSCRKRNKELSAQLDEKILSLEFYKKLEKRLKRLVDKLIDQSFEDVRSMFHKKIEKEIK